MKKCCGEWALAPQIENRNDKGFFLEIKFCPQCGSSLRPLFSTSDFEGVKGKIYKAIQKIGGRSDLLVIVGGWRDTKDDIDTSGLLDDFLGYFDAERLKEVQKMPNKIDDILRSMHYQNLTPNYFLEKKKVLFKAITEDIRRWPKGKPDRSEDWHRGVYAAESALAEILGVKE